MSEFSDRLGEAADAARTRDQQISALLDDIEARLDALEAPPEPEMAWYIYEQYPGEDPPDDWDLAQGYGAYPSKEVALMAFVEEVSGLTVNIAARLEPVGRPTPSYPGDAFAPDLAPDPEPGPRQPFETMRSPLDMVLGFEEGHSPSTWEQAWRTLDSAVILMPRLRNFGNLPGLFDTNAPKPWLPRDSFPLRTVFGWEPSPVTIDGWDGASRSWMLEEKGMTLQTNFGTGERGADDGDADDNWGFRYCAVEGIPLVPVRVDHFPGENNPGESDTFSVISGSVQRGLDSSNGPAYAFIPMPPQAEDVYGFIQGETFDGDLPGGRFGRGDRHITIFDYDRQCTICCWETEYDDDADEWTAKQVTIVPFGKDQRDRPMGWTSSDAMGSPTVMAQSLEYEGFENPTMVLFPDASLRPTLGHHVRMELQGTRTGDDLNPLTGYVTYAGARHGQQRGNHGRGYPLVYMGEVFRIPFGLTPPEGQDDWFYILWNTLQAFGAVVADGGKPGGLGGVESTDWDLLQSKYDESKHGPGFTGFMAADIRQITFAELEIVAPRLGEWPEYEEAVAPAVHNPVPHPDDA